MATLHTITSVTIPGNLWQDKRIENREVEKGVAEVVDGNAAYNHICDHFAQSSVKGIF
jgi:hypothetical protein